MSMGAVQARSDSVSASWGSKSTSRGRIEWIDVAKGLGIILVVIGHVRAEPYSTWVYYFHMPMFFMLSGMVFKAGPMPEFAARRTRSLLLPYLTFLIFVTLIDNIAQIIGPAGLIGALRYDIHQLRNDFYGGRRLASEFGVMWFITCLFVSLIIYNGLRLRIAEGRSGGMVAIIAGLFLASYIVAPISLPWDVAEVPMAIVFIWLGEAWFASFGELPPGTVLVSPITLVAAVVAGAGYFETLPMDMKQGDLGTPFATALVAMAWSHLFLLASKFLAQWRPSMRILVSIGQASLVILFTHRLLTDRLLADLYPPVLAIVSILMPYLLYRLIRSAAPVWRLLFLGEPLPAGGGELRRTGNRSISRMTD